MYAQTILELLNHLRNDGLSANALCRVHNAYDLATETFAGLFRPSGKTFLAHAVGTGSILHAVGAPLDLTIAGLIHSIYAHGDFGRRHKGVTAQARREVRSVVGNEVEDIVAHYATFRWNRSLMPDIAASMNSYGSRSRAVVLMRLANEVEENLDGGVLYLPDAERRRQADNAIVPFLVAMAEDLENPMLVSELHRVFAETMAAEIPPGFSDGRPSGVIARAPLSCLRRLPLTLEAAGARATRLAGRILRRPVAR